MLMNDQFLRYNLAFVIYLDEDDEYHNKKGVKTKSEQCF